MKANKFFYGIAALGLTFAGLMQSCVSDEPFANGEGEGKLRVKLKVSSNLTRAEINDDALNDSCVVYISKAGGGLVQKYKGLSNIPEEIMLKSGNYILEAWTGDSVTASFDKRFYRGYQDFQISNGNNTAVSMVCGIANVVVSINSGDVQLDKLKDWKITVSNSRDHLVFDKDNYDSQKGYFMMPNADIAKDADGNTLRNSDDPGFSYYTNLNYTIEGINEAGEEFSKSGQIGRLLADKVIVERAHEYVLNLEYNPEYEELGGSFINIRISDEAIPETTYEFGIYSRPSIKGYEFNIDDQLFASQGAFTDKIVKISGFFGFENLVLSSDDFEAFGLPQSQVNIVNLASDDQKDILNNLGISWTNSYDDERQLATCYLTLGANFLNKLKERPNEYVLNIAANDKKGKSNEVGIHIAVGEGAIIVKDPITIDESQIKNNLLSVRANYATVSGKFNDDNVVNPRIRYRKAIGGEWNIVPIPQTRAGREFNVVLNELEAGTTYEYQAIAEGFENPKTTYSFTTETTYSIPNGNLEEWSTYGNKSWDLPAAGGVKSFWDNGNAGASTLTKNNICAKTSEKVHTGSFAAKLETKSIMNQLAAGNLFAGEFGSATLSPLGAKLTFGRPYDGSHPESMRVWAHYTPQKVTKAGQNLTTSDMDYGQIYVAFVNGEYKIDTGNKIYFDFNSDQVLGYGEKIWKGTGTSGSDMEELILNITWKDSAKTVKPTHIVIVCSASMYGDYFVGGTGSVMYVDDFELVY